MSQPKFSVGEVVILQCSDFPHLNGEYTVSQIVFPGKEYTDPVFGQLLRCEGGLGYYLDGCPLVLADGDGRDAAPLWFESALKKRHQPGEYSWQDLKTRLVLPVSRDEVARLDRERCV